MPTEAVADVVPGAAKARLNGKRQHSRLLKQEIHGVAWDGPVGPRPPPLSRMEAA